MKYMLLCYDDAESWEQAGGQAAREEAMQEAIELTHEMKAKGQYIVSAPLHPTSTATSVRVRDGKRLVTDGPFAETREHLGGFHLIDADNLDDALALAARHPGARHGAVEIRPVLEVPGLPSPEISDEKSAANTKIYVNLPVKDLARSVEFFTKLGYEFNPHFTDETATCMIVSDKIYVMLLTQAKFREFTPNPVSDASSTTEVLVALSCDSRQAVDEHVRKAVDVGGKTFSDPRDYGFMYQHAFQDLDGHIWELVWMDPQGPS